MVAVFIIVIFYKGSEENVTEKQINEQRTLRQRFNHNHSIVGLSLITTVFATFLWYGKLQQLKGVPPTHDYWVVAHSFDNGLLFAVLVLGLYGFYVALSKKSTQQKRVAFLIIGFSIWTAYALLFLYRDRLFPHPPSLQSMLIAAIAAIFLINLTAGDA